MASYATLLLRDLLICDSAHTRRDLQWPAPYSDLVTVVGPRTEPHRAVLFVEREKLDVHRTRALVDGWRFPVHQAGRVNRRLRHQRHFVITVGAVQSVSKRVKCELIYTTKTRRSAIPDCTARSVWNVHPSYWGSVALGPTKFYGNGVISCQMLIPFDR